MKLIKDKKNYYEIPVVNKIDRETMIDIVTDMLFLREITLSFSRENIVRALKRRIKYQNVRLWTHYFKATHEQEKQIQDLKKQAENIVDQMFSELK